MLHIYFHRKYSGLIASVSLVLVAAGGISLARASDTMPVILQVAGWAIIMLLFWGIIAGLRQLWRPPLMYSADRRGVMIYYDAERVRFTGEGVFLPWSLVASLALEKRTSVGATRNRLNTWVIACALHDKAPFPVPKHSVGYTPQDGQRVVCLDAFSGTISGEEMLHQLLTLRQPTAFDKG